MGACVCGVGREDGMRSDISSTNFDSYIYFALPWGNWDCYWVVKIYADESRSDSWFTWYSSNRFG